jgi:hypothetical protein
MTPKTGIFSGTGPATPCGHIVIREVIPKTPLRTPLSWPPWPWFALKDGKMKRKVSGKSTLVITSDIYIQFTKQHHAQFKKFTTKNEVSQEPFSYAKHKLRQMLSPT